MKEIKETGKNDLTELVFLLDRSGSMAGLEADTIGGFNAMLEKQRKEDGRCYVSTVLFDHETEVLHDRVPLDSVAPITEKEYFVRGSTALIDAIGRSISHIGNVHKYARAEDVPEHTLFIITTDGMENASKRYSADEVRRMVEQKKEEAGWEFLFIGANIDAVETARRYGIGRDRAVNFNCDAEGQHVVYEVVSETVSAFRANAAIKPSWSRKIAMDFEKRKK